ncbi:hypothetical protein MmiAt1_04170 [Methanimicrococcus sp. At1]|uniref:Uncharacterized protein n=1 Tax=Methanimicrococcus hacksteinii TaxID=3028293 RepID=A0ABU3VN91_9EURY|nr:hypothetical protein [Methanimicrococcus sp. At1]MDV0444872.1 hypothetical protein [Methanimicrococcus sp. At1]
MKKIIIVGIAVVLAALIVATPVLAYHEYGGGFYKTHHSQTDRHWVPAHSAHSVHSAQSDFCIYAENCPYNETCQNECHSNCFFESSEYRKCFERSHKMGGHHRR